MLEGIMMSFGLSLSLLMHSVIGVDRICRLCCLVSRLWVLVSVVISTEDEQDAPGWEASLRADRDPALILSLLCADESNEMRDKDSELELMYRLDKTKVCLPGLFRRIPHYA